MARLDESEEDFLAEEEEAEAEAEGQGRSGAVDDGGGENDAAGGGGGGGAPPSSPAAAFSFRNVSRLTVLGLGSLEGSRTSRLQAALALLLARVRFPRVVLLSPKKGAEEGSEGGEEEKDRNRCSLFAADPVFTVADRDALEELGFSVVAPEEAVEAGRARRRKSNEEGEEEEEKEEGSNDGLSFFYLPHCYPPVAEEVLEAHWNQDDIRKVAILGNSLSSVAEKMRKSSSVTATTTTTAAVATTTAAMTTTTTPRCLAAGSKSRARAAASSATIEASVVGPDLDAASARSGLGAAFNDMALHLFPRWTKEYAEI